MEVNVFKVGYMYGYMAYVSAESKKVLAIFHEQPYPGGTIAISPDADTECDYEFLKKKEPDMYNEILKIKGGELTYSYMLFNKDGEYGPTEKWVLRYEPYKKLLLDPDSRIEKVPRKSFLWRLR